MLFYLGSKNNGEGWIVQQLQKRAQMTPDASFGLIFVVSVIFFLQHGTGPGPEKMSWTWPGLDLGQSS